MSAGILLHYLLLPRTNPPSPSQEVTDQTSTSPDWKQFTSPAEDRGAQNPTSCQWKHEADSIAEMLRHVLNLLYCLSCLLFLVCFAA